MSGVLMAQRLSALALRCPFCGHDKAKCNEIRRGNYRRVGDNYQVVCNKCRARGPLVQDDPAQAIARWNAANAPHSAKTPPTFTQTRANALTGLI